VDRNGYGVVAYSTDASAVVKISVRNSQLVGNSNFGAFAESDAGALATLSVSNSIVSNNGAGIAIFGARGPGVGERQHGQRQRHFGLAQLGRPVRDGRKTTRFETTPPTRRAQ
jgi:hypothetical protein